MNSAEKKQRISPSLRKILLLLICLMALLLICATSFFIFSAVRSLDAEKERITSAVQSGLGTWDDALSQVNMYLAELLNGSSSAKAIRDAEDIHSRNVAARALWDEIDKQTNFWSDDFNLLFYRPADPLTVTHFSPGGNFKDNSEITKLVKEQVSRGNYGNSQFYWSPCIVNGRIYLLQLYFSRDTFAACWVPCTTILSFIDDIIPGKSIFYAVLDADNLPLLGTSQLEPHGLRYQGGEILAVSSGTYRQTFSMRRSKSRIFVSAEMYLNQHELTFILGFFGATLLIVLLFAAFTLFYFHRYIEVPFRQFQAHIGEYANARRISRRRGFAELDQAVEAFDSLTSQLNELKIDVYEEKLALAKTELEYFQLQIKPHFFVNCFSILFGMAQKKDCDRIQDFCLKLSAHVRYLFHDGLSTVTLGEELAVLQEYLEIQNIRHRTRSQLQNTVPPQLLSQKIPPLLLLSFAENSVKHSDTDAGDLVVSIDVSCLEQDGEPKLSILIEDNLSRFSRESLKALNDREFYESREMEDSTKSIGVRNTYKRLALFYGDRFSLRFRNSEIGACVEIILPREK